MIDLTSMGRQQLIDYIRKQEKKIEELIDKKSGLEEEISELKERLAYLENE